MNSTIADTGERSLPLAQRAADEKYCHSCGNVLHFSANSCTRCGATQVSQSWSPSHLPTAVPAAIGPGTPLPVGHVFCRGCGQSIHETAYACPKCGAQQRTGATGAAPGSSRITAAVLAILIGGLGAHKFYLGKIFMGLLYLVFCWTFIPAVIALIEGIYYLTLSDQEFSAKHGG